MADVKADLNNLRASIKATAIAVIGLKKHEFFEPRQIGEEELEKMSEMKANIMLAYRHLEDARMRLGKAIQAHDGGVSIYDT